MRIASLQPSITLTLAALGRLDRLCAVTRYCVEALPELASRGLPVLEDSWSFDRQPSAVPGRLDRARSSSLDLLETARPDIVLASVPYRLESLAAILKSGLPVLALAPKSLADIEADIRLIATLVQADPAPVIRTMQETVAATRLRTALVPVEHRPLVYCEEWGQPQIRSQAWVAELVEAAGGRFVGTPGGHTTAEEVAAADPDVILFAWCGVGDRVPLARVVALRHWAGLRAVREGRVHTIPDEFLNTPAPTLMQGLACIAAALHPGLFPLQPRLISLSPPSASHGSV